ncbi:Protein-serine/threonine phosphatase [Heracleum sosnowskyi]|uniref:protein-serine/threonine phosphatase n=1 Tax=Heracleum sosnowskyi TaxID=360622 RepID=A0AAD8HUZ2_9APIA|nr:Protein-serine/threonine phosphatase [Heracleum sosnowskyi]
MTCSVSLSPGFSPSKSSSQPHYTSLSSSPEMRTLTHSPPKLQQPSSELVKGSDDAVSSGVTSRPTSWKRKRPSKLVLPMRYVFGLSRAAERRFVEAEGDGYAVYCMRGRKEAMEDRYSAKLTIHGHPKQAMFGIYDGHGGAKAAEYAAANLIKNVIEQVDKMGDQDIVEAVKLGNGELVVSNAGDCRAVISRGGVAVALTSDHRPSREDEKSRVMALGGLVECTRGGVLRINGSLAVSRGIGDECLKPWVIAEPETKVLAIEPDFEFLILASDGLWDKVSNQEAVDVVRAKGAGIGRLAALAVCKELAGLSFSRGSRDDISVMVVAVGQFCG